MKPWSYALFVFLGGCCFGVLSTFVKLAYEAGFTLGAVTGSQFLFGTALIWAAVIFSKSIRLQKKTILYLLASGVPMGLTGIFYYQSLQTLHASLAIIFLFQFIWIGALLEWVIDKRRPSRQKLVSIAILLGGSLLAARLYDVGAASFSLSGALWGSLAACTFATFIYTSGTVGKHVPVIQKSALLATGGLIITYSLFPPLFFVDGSLSDGLVFYGFFLGLFGVTLPPLLFSIGMPHVGSGLGTILSASELPVAVAMSALVLSEQITLLQWLGVVVILIGIALGNFSRKQIQLIYRFRSES